MIRILCLAPNVYEILAIKKRIQDEIFACKDLPYYQRWVRPGESFYPMRTENCEIDFRLPNPDKTGGLNVDLVYGVFDCDYSDELIGMLTGKRSLGLQKKYGKSELPIWEIVLEIEKQYASVMEGIFIEKNKEGILISSKNSVQRQKLISKLKSIVSDLENGYDGFLYLYDELVEKIDKKIAEDCHNTRVCNCCEHFENGECPFYGETHYIPELDCEEDNHDSNHV